MKSMNTVFLIHGAYSTPTTNWFPWLREQLIKEGNLCFAPAFPTPHNQSLATWQATFKPFLKYVTQDTIFVGHSLGCAFILNVLEQLKQPVTAAYFVAGFMEPLGNPKFDTINATFYDKTFDWAAIKNSCRRFHVFHADNDPYVSLEIGRGLAMHLGVSVDIIKGAEHFNIKTFPQLLKKIKESHALP